MRQPLMAAALGASMLVPAQVVPLDSKAFTVDVSLTVTSINPLVLEGTTNLPDGMKLSAILVGFRHLQCNGQQNCMVNQAGQEFTVQHGHFKFTAKPGQKAPATAWQLVIIGMVGGADDPANVVAALGANGEHMLGPYTDRSFVRDASKAGGGYTLVSVQYQKVICVLPNGRGVVQPWTAEAQSMIGACR
jgi:hypothetical protein